MKPLPDQRKVLTLTFVLAAALLAGAGGRANAARRDCGLLLVVVNRLTVGDTSADPQFAHLLRDAAIGLVSPSCVGLRIPGAVFASTAAGVPCMGTPDYGLVFNWNETYDGGSAADAYARRCGLGAPSQGLVHTGLASVIAANRKLQDPPATWTLGQALEAAGIGRAAFGNSDLAETDTTSRMGAALVTDGSGTVPAGDVSGRSLTPDVFSPGGAATDLARLEPLVVSGLNSGAVVALEFGDLERIETVRGAFTPKAYLAARAEAVSRLAASLARMSEKCPRTPILVLSLVPPMSEGGKWDSLGFAAISGPSLHQGVLTSNTTRTHGVIAAIDITPTILALLDVQLPHGLVGYTAKREPETSPTDELVRWNQAVQLNDELSFPIILGLGVLAGIAGTLAIWYVAGGRKKSVTGRSIIVLLALSSWIPAILLVPLDRSGWYSLLAPLLLAGFVLGASKEKRRFLPLDISGGAVLLGVALSAFGVVDWIQRSVLSTYQLTGFRFYGIGNEYMGCVIGAVALGALWRYGFRDEAAPIGALAAWFGLWVLILGLPALGANWGGAVAATATFGLVLRALAGKQITLRSAVLMSVAGLAVGITLMALDALLWGGAPTHLGVAARSIREGNAGFVWAIIQRKLVMNAALWGTVEARITAGIFLFLFALVAVNREKILHVIHLPAKMLQGYYAVAYGSLVALVFNDSGLVSAAFILAFAMVWWLWNAVTLKSGGLPVIRRQRARARG